VTCYRVYGDPSGETRVTPVELPLQETPVGKVRSLGEVPVTSAGMAQFVDSRKPDSGLHPAPRRQFVVVLGGVLQIVTTTGEEAHLEPGDVLLADDVEAKGHYSRDVGAEPLTMMTVAIGKDWQFPQP
jgi:hypothetical protein